MHRIFLFFITALVSATSFSQHTLTFNITDVRSTKGTIRVALYNSESSFLQFEDVFASAEKKAIIGTTSITFQDVPKGTYAVALFHDENANEELDTNFIGIPKEPVAFSKAKMKTFGPPSFTECSFTVSADTTLAIPMHTD